MAGLSIWHVLIFAIVVILLFGTAKLKNLGKDVGGAVKWHTAPQTPLGYYYNRDLTISKISFPSSNKIS